MLEERGNWIRRRFGNLEGTTLGNIEDVKDLIWPDIVKHFEVNGNDLTYRMIPEIEGAAQRIAEIFRKGVDEMVGNSDLEWHHHPERIVERVRSGDWSFYGCYLDGELIAAQSLHIIRGDRTMEWVWGCVDPDYRGRGVWQHIGEFTDLIVEMSGAQLGCLWAVTTHKYSQMAAEQAGYTPMGCFIGKRLYGGSDNLYYRHTLILYAKLYGAGKLHLQDWAGMELTEKAARVAGLVRELWDGGKR